MPDHILMLQPSRLGFGTLFGLFGLPWKLTPVEPEPPPRSKTQVASWWWYFFVLLSKRIKQISYVPDFANLWAQDVPEDGATMPALPKLVGNFARHPYSWWVQKSTCVPADFPLNQCVDYPYFHLADSMCWCESTLDDSGLCARSNYCKGFVTVANLNTIYIYILIYYVYIYIHIDICSIYM